MKTLLEDAESLVSYPIHWKPETVDQCAAAIVGYNLGDGTITKRKYGYSAAFYGEGEGLEQIAECFKIAFCVSMNVGFKKGSRRAFDSQQLQVGDKETVGKLIELGCIVGKKVAQTFPVPEWIYSHSDINVKRAFVAALWGAEGSSPLQQHRTLKMPVLCMHKHIGQEFGGFFCQVQNMMVELGIETVLKQSKSPTGTANYIYVNAGIDNVVKFLTECGYIFSAEKADKAWLWSKYMMAMRYDATKRREDVLQLVPKHGYAGTARLLGLSRGGVFSTYNSTGTAFQAARNFPKFNEWVKDRQHNGGLRLRVVKKKTTESIRMFNVLVSSPDHSYLLANGINNFNSFETASGRVYADYGNENHTDRIFDPSLPIYWTHDFNFTPMSSAICQVIDGKPYVVDEIILESAVARESAAEFIEKYKGHERQTIRIYGDASGHAGEKHGHASDYIEIRQALQAAGFENVTMKVPRSNPSIKDGQNSLRAKILNAAGERSFFVNPAKAKHVDKGLKTTQLKEGSTFQEEDSPYQHVTTALRYMTNVEWPIQRNTVTTSNGW